MNELFPRKAVLLSLLAIGCGRIGFEPLAGGAGVDDGGDGQVSPCTPELIDNTPYAAGSGTAEDPNQICSSAQLVALANQPEDFGTIFVLMGDVDFAGVPFGGIGTSALPFTGVIDGNGYSIQNLTVSGVAGEPVGFVNVALAAQLRNLTLSDVTIAGASSSEVGTVIGSCNQSQAFNSTVIRANVSGDSSVGGLVGYLNECEVHHATISATVVATLRDAGGVAGYSDKSVILDVDSEIDVKAPLATGVGGVVGSEGWSPLIVQRVSIQGSIEGNEDVGGIVGGNYDGARIYRSSFTGTIRGNTAVGGIVGGAYDSPFLVYSTTVTADIVGNSGVGGFTGRHYYRTRFFDSHFKGTITGAGANQGSLGGFFGDVEYYGWVERSYVDVTINSEAPTVGGFAGHIGYWSSSADLYDITNSFSVANVSGSGPGNTVSLFVGENTDPNPLAAAGSYYWAGGACVNAGTGGCGAGGMSVAEIGQFRDPGAAPLSTWDFDKVWQVQAGGFPTLRTEQLGTPVVNNACPPAAIIGLRYECDLGISDADLNEEQFVVFGPAHSCSWLSSSTSPLLGVPTAEDTSSCAAEFTVTDGANESAAQVFSIDLHAGVVMTPASSTGASYSMGFVDIASGGSVQVFTLTNNESVPVAGLSVSPPPASDFTFDGGTYPGTGGTCATTLAPAQTCTLAIRFDPTIAATITEAIAIHFTAARGPVSYNFTVSGTGR